MMHLLKQLDMFHCYPAILLLTQLSCINALSYYRNNDTNNIRHHRLYKFIISSELLSTTDSTLPFNNIQSDAGSISDDRNQTISTVNYLNRNELTSYGDVPLQQQQWSKQQPTKMITNLIKPNISIKGMQSSTFVKVNRSNKDDPHFLEMINATNCHYPAPRVVRVNDLYPHPHISYYPSCTILNRCSDDTGCCPDPTKRCAPHKTASVTLYFATTDIRQLRMKSWSNYTALKFLNHTECICKTPIDDQMPRDGSEVNEIHQKTISTSTSKSGCVCPSEYNVRYMPDGQCTCECFHKQISCIELNKGIKYFSLMDRFCIVTGECLAPNCDYGRFIRRLGRCPRRHKNAIDNNSSQSQISNNYLPQ